MAGIDYPYDVLSAAIVFNSQKEHGCPLQPKLRIRGRDEIDRVLSAAFTKCRTDQTFSANIRAIANRTLADQRTCSYHFARALAAATMEAVGGPYGPEYREFLAPLSASSTLLPVNAASHAYWARDVDLVLGYFIEAAETGGLKKFMHLYRETEKAAMEGQL